MGEACEALPGRHVVRFDGSVCEIEEAVVEVKRGETIDIESALVSRPDPACAHMFQRTTPPVAKQPAPERSPAPPPPSARAGSVAPVALIAAGFVGVSIGTGVALHQNDKALEHDRLTAQVAREDPACASAACAELSGARDAEDRARLAANLFFAGGAALVASGIGFALLLPGEERDGGGFFSARGARAIALGGFAIASGLLAGLYYADSLDKRDDLDARRGSCARESPECWQSLDARSSFASSQRIAWAFGGAAVGLVVPIVVSPFLWGSRASVRVDGTSVTLRGSF